MLHKNLDLCPLTDLSTTLKLSEGPGSLCALCHIDPCREFAYQNGFSQTSSQLPKLSMYWQSKQRQPLLLRFIFTQMENLLILLGLQDEQNLLGIAPVYKYRAYLRSFRAAWTKSQSSLLPS